MSIAAGPNIVSSDNLVFAYDMSNTKKSWIGAPTTNLYDFSYYQSEGGHAAVRTLGNAPGLSTPVTDYHTISTTGSWVGESNRLIIWPSTPLTASTLYRVSFWARSISKASTTIKSSFYSNGVNNIHNISNEWTRFSYSSTTHSLFRALEFGSNDGAITFQIAGIQWENGSYVTPYTQSSRSTTQAILDIARNNTITANSLTYASDGTFSFNGSSNYISTTINSFSMYCLNIWLYNNNAVPNNETAIGGPSTYQTLVQFNNAYPTGINLGGWSGGMTNEAVQIWTGTSGSYTATYNRDAVPVGWHNFVFNWNGANYDIWIDGVKTTTYTMNGGATLQTITSLQIGYSSPGYYFNGKIPLVSCYSSQLSDANVIQNFNSLRSRFGL